MKRLTRLTFYLLALSSILFQETLFAQWIQQQFPSSEYLWKVRFINPTTGWILGQDYLYRTTDGGSSWTAQDASGAAGSALLPASSQTILYANFSGTATTGIRRSTDGGKTWHSADTALYYYTRFVFIDSLTGIAVGARVSNGGATFHPAVRRSTDAGATWSTVWTRSTPFELTGVSFSSPTDGWAVTYDGVLFQTTDAGSHWTMRDSLGSFPVRDLELLGSGQGWLVGGIGGIMLIGMTTDDGQTWSDTSADGGSAREVEFLTGQRGWIVGLNDEPLTTTDGGTTWTRQVTIPRFTGFESISMVDVNLGFAVGGNGMIYRTNNGGVVPVLEAPPAVPVRTTLGQNYPNPFNPTTRIEYRIAESGPVTLKVYNVLGGEVATLVNGVKPPGIYEVTWDAAGFASGVYFCRLETSTTVQTRQIVLLR